MLGSGGVVHDGSGFVLYVKSAPVLSGVISYVSSHLSSFGDFDVSVVWKLKSNNIGLFLLQKK